jgi:hypothetical protein
MPQKTGSGASLATQSLESIRKGEVFDLKTYRYLLKIVL